MKSENIIGSGAKRLRHGSYRSIYLDNHGLGRRMWRAEYQAVNAGGVVRLRRWFADRELAVKWLNGR